MFFNHSCDPNCGFAAIDSGLATGKPRTAMVVAIRDIEVGEELTYDYQFMDTEPSFYDGINCRCGTRKCRGVLRFDQYRNVDWQKKYYKYCGKYNIQRLELSYVGMEQESNFTVQFNNCTFNEINFFIF